MHLLDEILLSLQFFLTFFLVALPPGVLLFEELFLLELEFFRLLDRFDQDCFVLVLVTLRGKVEFMKLMFVNLPLRSVLLQKPSQRSLPSHPADSCGHSRLFGAPSLARSAVSSLADSLLVEPCTSPGVDREILSNN